MDYIPVLRRRIRRLEKVLGFYAPEAKYDYEYARSVSLCPDCGRAEQDRYEPDILQDRGKRASKILKEEA